MPNFCAVQSIRQIFIREIFDKFTQQFGLQKLGDISIDRFIIHATD